LPLHKPAKKRGIKIPHSPIYASRKRKPGINGRRGVFSTSERRLYAMK
jgi:hypothetical protein